MGAALVSSLAALVGIVVGAILTARLQRAALYSDWRRDRIYELYVELIPILRRVEQIPDEAWERAIETTPRHGALEELRALMPRAEVLCSRETTRRMNNVYTLLSAGGAPWYVRGEERRTFRGPKLLGVRSARTEHVASLLRSLERDLKGQRQPVVEQTHDAGPAGPT